MRSRFVERFFALPATLEAPSGISVPGSRALVVEPGRALGPRDAFLIDREFAHVHFETGGITHPAHECSVAQIVAHPFGAKALQDPSG